MSKYKDLYQWLKQCPQLNKAWFLRGEYIDYSSVIMPSDTANPISAIDVKDYTDHSKIATSKPSDIYYEDYQINIYMETVSRDNGFNMERLDETQAICDWLIEQRNFGNIPVLFGVNVYAFDILTPNPFIRGVDDGIIGYFVTIRIYRDNPMKPITWEM